MSDVYEPLTRCLFIRLIKARRGTRFWQGILVLGGGDFVEYRKKERGYMDVIWIRMDKHRQARHHKTDEELRKGVERRQWQKEKQEKEKMRLDWLLHWIVLDIQKKGLALSEHWLCGYTTYLNNY